ncbi:MAG: mechanosensitive ion channel family protein [Muribaculaceae bacterium]|nr:mechanosensitive ion channel family protein [Muribaculaceae bacterium]
MADIGAIAGEEIDVSLIESYLQTLPEKALHFGIRVLLALIALFIGMQLIKLIRKIFRKSMERSHADVGVMQFLDSFIKTALYVLLGFMIASGFGLDAASVVALLGSVGVAIGLAIQGSLSNFAGGVLILLLKPFKIGDYIITVDQNQGTVTEIQLFYTKLTTADNRMIVIPNGELSNSSMTNVSAMPRRRIDISVGISYRADIKEARKIIMKLLEADEGVLQEEEKVVFVDMLGESAVILGVRFHTATENYWETKWRVQENIKYALDEGGIEIPYNQLDVHMSALKE